MKKVLIFPAGTEIAFEIQNALKFSKFVELYGGTSADDHSEFTYKRLIKGFPYIEDDGFIAFLNKVIDEYQIDCIYPAHDSVCALLSKNKQNINCQVIISDEPTTSICRSKAKTYEYFKEYDFIPTIYKSIDEIDVYPVFAKPCVGQGSVGTQKIRSRSELDQLLSDPDGSTDRKNRLVICEYLPGSEFTVDCFTDRHGNLLSISQRTRDRIRCGISVRSRKLDTDIRVHEIATILNEKLSFKGAWFFQLKMDKSGNYKLLEISPRIPGTMGLSRNLGINYPMLTLFTFWDYDVSVIENDYDIELDRAFYSSYRISYEYEHIYLDFDDTLILGNEVNSDIMKFLYQAVFKGKKIHLLSKHATDIFEDLDKYRISQKLFEDIVVIPKSEEKYNFINETNAIFIDDSFAERKRIHDEKGIPVFDVDMVESLIDYRR